MRIPFRRVAAMAWVAATLWLTSPAHAVPVVFGESWDGSSNNLQSVLDQIYGPGAIDVKTDYLGYKDSDIDPWFWVDSRFRSYLVREIAGNANYNVLGWYEETGGPLPVIDGTNDGVVFDGPAGAGQVTLITFSYPMAKFGFYLDPNGAGSIPYAPQPERFWTNRTFNDRGPSGTPVHAPVDGDVQALVFDISAIVGTPHTWLVCFEDLDSGLNPSACCATTDNDFNDLIFEVQAFGATPTVPLSFGQLKQIYR